MWPCPSPEELEGILTGDRADEDVERHIQACSACRSALSRLRDDHEFLQTFLRGNRQSLPQGSIREPGHAVVVAGYEILGEIHRGGQGVIYKAIQKATKREVALKMLLAGLGASSRQRHRFDREIEFVAELRHPNIVTLFEAGLTSDGGPFFAMEYVQGVPLDQYLGPSAGPSESAGRGRSTTDRLRLFVKICEAVEYAHLRGIIHRDLKPDNILVDIAGEPHVLDFGLARALGRDEAGPGWTITQVGEFMGTFAYAAPEQVQGNPNHVDTRTDVYALGMILYEMLTGASPYPVDGSLSNLIRNIVHSEPKRPSSRLCQIGDEVETILLTCLHKERERRYQAAGELLRDIRRHQAGEPIEAKRNSTWYVLAKTMRRHRGLVAVATTWMLFLTAFAVIMTVQARRIAAQRDAALTAERGRTIESGRMAGLAGDTTHAEKLLWAAHFTPQIGRQSGEGGNRGDGGPPDSYWALWELYARQPCLATWVAHEGNVWSVDFAPDGKLLASVGQDETIKLWRMPTSALYGTISAGETTSQVCFHPHGALLARGTRGGEISLWNVPENRLETVLLGHSSPIISVGFPPDGRTLVSGSEDGTVQLWNLETKEATILVDHDWPVWGVNTSTDGRLLASIDRSGTVKLWDLVTGVERGMLDHPVFLRHAVKFAQGGGYSHLGGAIDFRPNTTTLAIGFENQVAIWDGSAGAERPLYSHQHNVVSVRFSADGGWLASGSGDHTINLWKVERERLEHSYRGHESPVHRISFAPDGKLIASCAWGGTIRLWEVPPHQHLRKLTGNGHTVHCVQYSRDGRCLAAGYQDGRIEVRDAASEKAIHEMKGHSQVAAAVAFHPNGHQLASGSYDRTLKIWDLQTGTCIRSIQAHDDLINMIAYSPDGGSIASASGASAEHIVRLWDSATGDLLYTFEGHAGRVPYVCFSPDGKLLASCGFGGRGGNIYLHDLASRTARALLEDGKGYNARALCFSPDGRLLASGNDDGLITLWNISTRRQVDSWKASEENIFSLSFHPNGRILASAGRGNEIKLWNAAGVSDHQLLTLVGHEDSVFSLCFHPNGNSLASGSADTTIGLWDLTHYDRHIAGNLEYQISRLPKFSQDSSSIRRIRGWANGIGSRPPVHPPFAHGR